MTASSRWTMRTLASPPLFAGLPAGTSGVASIGVISGQSGLGIPMLGGGAVYQRTTAHRKAPLTLAPDLISISLDGITEEEHRSVERLKGLSASAPVEMFVDYWRTCEWIIDSGRTTWTLDRALPFGTVAYATYTPNAYVTDLNGGNKTALTIIPSGTPGSTEVLVSNSTNATTITTADLSASAGKLLVLEYHPLRLVRIESIERTYEYPDTGKQVVQLELAEHVPNRDWSA